MGLLPKFNLLRTEGKGSLFIKNLQGAVIIGTEKSVAVQGTEHSRMVTSLSFCTDPQTNLDFQKSPYDWPLKDLVTYSRKTDYSMFGSQ